jgi:hypothetical protein
VHADTRGIMPFDALILDLGAGGVAFLCYACSITLEPGTVLRGCRIALRAAATAWSISKSATRRRSPFPTAIARCARGASC